MPPTAELRVFFLNVGQADSTVIITPGGQVIIVDAYRPEKTVSLLQGLGLDKGQAIHCLVITHPHNDHYAGVPRLLGDYKVETVVLSPFWHYAGTAGYHAIVNAIQDKGIPVRFISGYERIHPDGQAFPNDAGQCALELLGPSSNMLGGLCRAGKMNPNHLSIIVRLSYAGFRMIVAADAQMENWAHFDHEGMCEGGCSVLRAAHHGSCRGTQWERLERLAPDCVVVSSDPEARDNLPDLIGAATFLEHGQDRLAVMTSATGTIRVTVDPKGVFRLSCFGERAGTDVTLTRARRLSRQSNPTNWRRLVSNKMRG